MNNRSLDWSDDRKFRAGYDAGYTNGHEDGYKTAKSETPQPAWIRCSERLPETDDDYLVTIEFRVLNVCARITSLKHFKNEGGWSGEKMELTTYAEVLAWQPLPDPYPGEA